MTRKLYPSDLNDDEWELIKPLIPSYKGIGYPLTIKRREIINMVRIETILADSSYRGSLAEILSQADHCTLKVTEKLGEGFVVAPWRWVVERTFSWLDKSRRLCRDYEVLPENHEAVIYIAMIRIMLRRLTDNRRRRKP